MGFSEPAQNMLTLWLLREYLRVIVDLVPDHHIVNMNIHNIHKVSIAVEKVTQIFWFASAQKSYAYTLLQSINCIITLYYLAIKI